MENLPWYISPAFILTTMITLFIFFRAIHRPKTVVLIIAAWLLLQGLVSNAGWYTKTARLPPPFVFAVLPPLLLIMCIFISPRGRQFIDRLNIRPLTILHIIRIPVELILFWLCTYRTVPSIMTFEGHNFDILSGLTAPFIYYSVFVQKKLSNRYLLIWNILCLVLLLNIFITAVLAAPFRFQQLAFQQPNIAILYFPFAWLPSCIVPVVLFSHLASVRLILNNRKGPGSRAGLQQATL